eukprot:CAMPEP_0183791538 /NCGR_PEP_ID=MMETSP0803_2-20130417/1926_1 /TAXON_ID=195967 /ORGANISM="Crustomastix stigmata, Strain CCMP3273" /LENGTH=382 /DNA_ID=CAMNT_0026035857 /DNA_START=83 /DNA_END=1231 /DNA_ORIENTATION=-
MQFDFANRTKLVFGKGQLTRLAGLLPPEEKILLLYGSGSIKRSGLYEEVCKALEGHEWIEFGGISPNPTVESLQDPVDIVARNSIGFILAVGGGSVIDGAKYISAVANSPRETDWKLALRETKSAIPLGTVLTLPATGSESNCGFVITEAKTKDKLAFIIPEVQPEFAVLDPELTKSLSDRQIHNGLADAWVHVCEQYLTYPTGAILQDGYAETILKCLLHLAGQRDNKDESWWANFMWATNQAQYGLIGCGVPHDWATHLIGHEFTALYSLDHACSLTIIHCSLLRYTRNSKTEKLRQMARNVFSLQDTARLDLQCIEKIELFYNSLQLPTAFIAQDYGLETTDVRSAVLSQLKRHGITNMGETQDVTLSVVANILQDAVV